MEDMWSSMKTAINRRSFMRNGLTAAGVGLLANSSSVLADNDHEDHDEHDRRLTRGDAARSWGLPRQRLPSQLWLAETTG